MDTPVTGRIENWAVVAVNVDPYKPPEQIKYRISGNIYDHASFKDGTFITTSKIVKAENEHIYTGSGSVYYLGAVAPDYEVFYPDARERLFKPDQYLV